jgi:hypothetical protein
MPGHKCRFCRVPMVPAPRDEKWRPLSSLWDTPLAARDVRLGARLVRLRKHSGAKSTKRTALFVMEFDPMPPGSSERADDGFGRHA